MILTRLRIPAVVAAGLGAVLLAAAPAHAAPPPNDDFGDAVPIAQLPFESTVDTTEATRAADDPGCFGPEAHTVWYELNLDTTRDVIVDTVGSDYDTTLSVWTGDRGDLSRVVCDDNTDGVTSQVLFTADASVTYHIMAASLPLEAGGTLVLNGREAPPPVELAVTLDPTGTVTDSGEAVIHGMVSCSRPVQLPGWGTLRQDPAASGQPAAVGSFRTSITCGGVSEWEARVVGETARYRPGRATGVVYVEYVDPVRGDVVWARGSGAVRLR